MSTIKEYNVKLKSLKNTRKITKTMKMVSASKLRKAQEAQSKAKLFARHLSKLVSRLSLNIDIRLHPLLQTRAQVKKILTLIITSDKGLCGAFNHNANKRVAAWIEENRNRNIEISCGGKRGYLFFKKKHPIKMYYENIINKPQFSDAIRIGQDLTAAFSSKNVDEVFICYNQFFSPLSQKTLFEKNRRVISHHSQSSNAAVSVKIRICHLADMYKYFTQDCY